MCVRARAGVFVCVGGWVCVRGYCGMIWALMIGYDMGPYDWLNKFCSFGFSNNAQHRKQPIKSKLVLY